MRVIEGWIKIGPYGGGADVPHCNAHQVLDADCGTGGSQEQSDHPKLPPGAEMMQGRSAIAAFWQQQMRQIGDVKHTALDVKPLGPNAARKIGTCSFKTKAQQPQVGALIDPA